VVASASFNVAATCSGERRATSVWTSEKRSPASFR
jgi:hypothetical protein